MSQSPLRERITNKITNLPQYSKNGSRNKVVTGQKSSNAKLVKSSNKSTTKGLRSNQNMNQNTSGVSSSKNTSTHTDSVSPLYKNPSKRNLEGKSCRYGEKYCEKKSRNSGNSITSLNKMNKTSNDVEERNQKYSEYPNQHILQVNSQHRIESKEKVDGVYLNLIKGYKGFYGDPNQNVYATNHTFIGNVQPQPSSEQKRSSLKGKYNVKLPQKNLRIIKQKLSENKRKDDKDSFISVEQEHNKPYSTSQKQTPNSSKSQNSKANLIKNNAKSTHKEDITHNADGRDNNIGPTINMTSNFSKGCGTNIQNINAHIGNGNLNVINMNLPGCEVYDDCSSFTINSNNNANSNYTHETNPHTSNKQENQNANLSSATNVTNVMNTFITNPLLLQNKIKINNTKGIRAYTPGKNQAMPKYTRRILDWTKITNGADISSSILNRSSTPNKKANFAQPKPRPFKTPLTERGVKTMKKMLMKNLDEKNKIMVKEIATRGVGLINESVLGNRSRNHNLMSYESSDKPAQKISSSFSPKQMLPSKNDQMFLKNRFAIEQELNKITKNINININIPHKNLKNIYTRNTQTPSKSVIDKVVLSGPLSTVYAKSKGHTNENATVIGITKNPSCTHNTNANYNHNNSHCSSSKKKKDFELPQKEASPPAPNVSVIFNQRRTSAPKVKLFSKHSKPQGPITKVQNLQHLKKLIQNKNSKQLKHLNQQLNQMGNILKAKAQSKNSKLNTLKKEELNEDVKCTKTREQEQRQERQNTEHTFTTQNSTRNSNKNTNTNTKRTTMQNSKLNTNSNNSQHSIEFCKEPIDLSFIKRTHKDSPPQSSHFILLTNPNTNITHKYPPLNYISHPPALQKHISNTNMHMAHLKNKVISSPRTTLPHTQIHHTNQNYNPNTSTLNNANNGKSGCKVSGKHGPVSVEFKKLLSNHLYKGLKQDGGVLKGNLYASVEERNVGVGVGGMEDLKIQEMKEEEGVCGAMSGDESFGMAQQEERVETEESDAADQKELFINIGGDVVSISAKVLQEHNNLHAQQNSQLSQGDPTYECFVYDSDDDDTNQTVIENDCDNDYPLIFSSLNKLY